MKRKIFKLILLFIALLTIVSCKSKDEESENKNMTEEIKQDLTIIEKNEDGTIKKGTLEKYTFTETDEKTSRVKIEM